MKNLVIISLSFLFVLGACSQFSSKSEVLELSEKVDSLLLKSDKLAEKNNALEIEILMLKYKYDSVISKQLKPVSPPVAAGKLTTPQAAAKTEPVVTKKEDKQCQAITSSGKRCSLTVIEGSKYCSVHKPIYEPDIPQKK